jgi:hypothetical protein
MLGVKEENCVTGSTFSISGYQIHTDTTHITYDKWYQVSTFANTHIYAVLREINTKIHLFSNVYLTKLKNKQYNDKTG